MADQIVFIDAPNLSDQQIQTLVETKNWAPGLYLYNGVVEGLKITGKDVTAAYSNCRLCIYDHWKLESPRPKQIKISTTKPELFRTTLARFEVVNATPTITFENY